MKGFITCVPRLILVGIIEPKQIKCTEREAHRPRGEMRSCYKVVVKERDRNLEVEWRVINLRV